MELVWVLGGFMALVLVFAAQSVFSILLPTTRIVSITMGESGLASSVHTEQYEAITECITSVAV